MQKTESNYEKVKKLRELHQPVFEALGVPGALFFPKMFYRPTDKEELYVSFFKSELQRGQDIYTEMADRDFVSEDQSRQLYRWNYNPQWADDYEYTKEPDKPVRYLVPVSELKKISNNLEILNGISDAKEKSKQTIEQFETDCIQDDCGLEEMTMKDLYAIIQNKPVSGKEWLNKLIKNVKL